MPLDGSVGNDVDINITALFGSLWRARARLLLAAVLVSALAFVAASLMTPQYRAETRVIIEARESVFTRADSAPGADAPILSPEGVKSQVQVMDSTDLLKKVAAKLDLSSYREFDPAAHVSTISRVLILLGLENDPNEMPKDERVLDAMRKKLDIYNVENSRVIVIQFSSQDRKLAAAVPNAVADEYIALQEAAKRQSNSEATNWLGPEITDLTKRVRDAEAKVAQYRASSGLLMGQNNAVLPTQRLSEIASELSRVQADRAASEAKAASVRDALKNGADVDTLPDVVASPLIQRLREQKGQLKSQIADLSTTLLDGHPRIKALKSQLADLDAQIRQEARKVLESLENAADIARRREADLTTELDRLKVRSAQAGEQEVELRALEREATAQRQLLESYMTRYREAASREDHHYLPADARVFSRAIVPGDPYFPKKIPIVATAFAATLLLGSVFILLRELFSGRALVSADELLAGPGEVHMPVAAGGGRAVAEADVPVTTADESLVDEPADEQPVEAVATARDEPVREPVSEGVPAIDGGIGTEDAAGVAGLEPSNADIDDFAVSAVARHLMKGGAARAVVVSPEGDEASATSVLLVRELADRGKRAILIDLTGTSLIGELMIEGEAFPGITDLLASERQFTDVIHTDHFSEAHVMPGGLADPVKAMRAVERLPIIVNALQSAYDMVVVECGATDIEGLERLAAPGTEIIVSVVDPEDRRVVAAASQLDEAGYHDLVFMASMGSMPVSGPSERRKGGLRRMFARS